MAHKCFLMFWVILGGMLFLGFTPPYNNKQLSRPDFQSVEEICGEWRDNDGGDEKTYLVCEAMVTTYFQFNSSPFQLQFNPSNEGWLYDKYPVGEVCIDPYDTSGNTPHQDYVQVWYTHNWTQSNPITAYVPYGREIIDEFIIGPLDAIAISPETSYSWPMHDELIIFGAPTDYFQVTVKHDYSCGNDLGELADLHANALYKALAERGFWPDLHAQGGDPIPDAGDGTDEVDTDSTLPEVEPSLPVCSPGETGFFCEDDVFYLFTCVNNEWEMEEQPCQMGCDEGRDRCVEDPTGLGDQQGNGDRELWEDSTGDVDGGDMDSGAPIPREDNAGSDAADKLAGAIVTAIIGGGLLGSTIIGGIVIKKVIDAFAGQKVETAVQKGQEPEKQPRQYRLTVGKEMFTLAPGERTPLTLAAWSAAPGESWQPVQLPIRINPTQHVLASPYHGTGKLNCSIIVKPNAPEGTEVLYAAMKTPDGSIKQLNLTVRVVTPRHSIKLDSDFYRLMSGTTTRVQTIAYSTVNGTDQIDPRAKVFLEVICDDKSVFPENATGAGNLNTRIRALDTEIAEVRRFEMKATAHFPDQATASATAIVEVTPSAKVEVLCEPEEIRLFQGETGQVLIEAVKTDYQSQEHLAKDEDIIVSPHNVIKVSPNRFRGRQTCKLEIGSDAAPGTYKVDVVYESVTRRNVVKGSFTVEVLEQEIVVTLDPDPVVAANGTSVDVNVSATMRDRDGDEIPVPAHKVRALTFSCKEGLADGIQISALTPYSDGSQDFQITIPKTIEEADYYTLKAELDTGTHLAEAEAELEVRMYRTEYAPKSFNLNPWRVGTLQIELYEQSPQEDEIQLKTSRYQVKAEPEDGADTRIKAIQVPIGRQYLYAITGEGDFSARTGCKIEFKLEKDGVEIPGFQIPVEIEAAAPFSTKFGRLRNAMWALVKQKLSDGYVVLNYTNVENGLNAPWKLGSKFADWVGKKDWKNNGTCGDFHRWGKTWAREIVDPIFGSAAVHSTIMIVKSKLGLNNHIANLLTLPDGTRRVLDFWESIAMTKPAILTEKEWISHWQKRLNNAGVVSRVFDGELYFDKELQDFIEELGRKKGEQAFRVRSKFNLELAEFLIRANRKFNH